MSDSDKIKLTVLAAGTMHADLTWLLINPANLGLRRPRDYLPGPDVRFATCWVLRVGLQRDV
jgi:hypothetical protein